MSHVRFGTNDHGPDDLARGPDVVQNKQLHVLQRPGGSFPFHPAEGGQLGIAIVVASVEHLP